MQASTRLFLFIRVLFGCITAKAISLDLLALMNVLRHCILECCRPNWVYKVPKCVPACHPDGETAEHGMEIVVPC